MPRVTIVMYEGRTIEQKRKLVKGVTDAIVQALDTIKPEHVSIAILDLPKTNVGRAGVLASD